MVSNWKINGDKSLFPEFKDRIFTFGYSEFIQSYLWAADPCTVTDHDSFIREAQKSCKELSSEDIERYEEAYTNLFSNFLENGGSIELW